MAATLATINDVVRQLQKQLADYSTAQQLQLQAALDAADSHTKKLLRWDPSLNGSGTSKYYDVAETDELLLPSVGAIVSQVRAYYGTNSVGTMLPSTLPNGSGYELTDDGRLIRLRPVLLTSPFAGAEASRLLMRYDRVEVDYTAVASVPADIREAVSILAAGSYASGPRLASGVTGERIGDYSYSTRQLSKPAPGEHGSPQDGPNDYYEAFLLGIRPWIKRKPLVT